jgi:hypothetical protein
MVSYWYYASDTLDDSLRIYGTIFDFKIKIQSSFTFLTFSSFFLRSSWSLSSKLNGWTSVTRFQSEAADAGNPKP